MPYENGMYTRENDFSRTQYNEAKLGAYYTDVGHMKSLSPLFSYTGDLCYALDPGCGDMEAMFALIDREKAKVCGVELNPQTAGETRKKAGVYALVEGDFTTDLLCTPGVFDFVFTNPAYMEVELDGKKTRLETLYLNRITGVLGKQGVLKKDGILVLVVNFGFFSDRNTLRHLMNHYEIVGAWRFREPEYSRFKQVVFVGKKTGTKVHTKEQVDEFCARFDAEEKIPVLPEVLPAKMRGSVQVPHSDEGALKVFTTREFNADAAMDYLTGKPDLPDFRKWVSRGLTQKTYASTDLEDPPVMPGLGNLFLQEVCGVGNGITGEEGEDLHLARGIVEQVDVVEVTPDPDDSTRAIEKVTTLKKVKMKTLEIVNEGGAPRTYISTLA